LSKETTELLERAKKLHAECRKLQEEAEEQRRKNHYRYSELYQRSKETLTKIKELGAKTQ